MKLNSRLTFKMLLILAALIGGYSSTYAWTNTATGPWASFSFSDGWTVYQDAWGAPNDNSCVLYANSSGNFACSVNYSGGGIKNYCHTQKDVDIPISSNYYCNSNFNYSAPNNLWWSFFYDVWTANMQDEMEIKEGWQGDGTWGTQVASNVTIGGKLIASVWQANNGSNNVIIFNPANQRTSGSEDIMAYFVWALNHGYLHNRTLHQVSFGVEVTYTSGTQQFTVNSFSASWGSNGSGGGGSTSYITLKNRATGLLVDGMGRNYNGANCGQWSSSGSYNQEWVIESAGSYIRLKNRATGLYLDGMGRSSNGSTAGQWGNSNSNNQQWQQVSAGSYVKFKNRATGLYLDGMGRSGNGSDLGQWSSSSSYNQQWSMTSTKSAVENIESNSTANTAINDVLLFPNPFTSEINLRIENPEKVDRIVVIDMLGKPVEIINHSSIENEQFIGSSLKAGMYVVQIYGTDNTQFIKIIKK